MLFVYDVNVMLEIGNLICMLGDLEVEIENKIYHYLIATKREFAFHLDYYVDWKLEILDMSSWDWNLATIITKNFSKKMESVSLFGLFQIAIITKVQVTVEVIVVEMVNQWIWVENFGLKIVQFGIWWPIALLPFSQISPLRHSIDHKFFIQNQ